MNNLIETLHKKQAISISAAAAATFVAYKIFKRYTKQTIDPNLLPPAIKGGLPVLGNLLELQKDPLNYLDQAKDTYGPCFSLKVPGPGKVVVVTGSLIQEVMRSTKNFSFTDGIETLVPTERVVELSYSHKFIGEKFNTREKNPIVFPLKHNFKENQIDIFSERIQTGLQKSLDKLLDIQTGEKRVVNIWDTLTYVISTISCPCFAGSKVGNDEELIVGMATFTQKIIRAGTILTTLPSWLGNFIVRRYLSVEYEMDLIMKLLVPELQKIRDGQDYEESFVTMVLNLLKENGVRRTVEDSAYHFKSVALASIHTTSHFASFALHELACRPSLVQDLRKEVATLGDDRTPETVAKLPLMDSFFREVLRCNADYLGLHHLTLKDTTLSTGHIIPKGSLVVCAIQQIHNDARFMPVDDDTGLVMTGETPLDQFDGYRFLNSNIKATAVSLGHLSFGLGAHACPGRYFAANEIKYVISEMITRYNMTTQSGKRAKDFVLLGMTKFPPREPLIFESI